MIALVKALLVVLGIAYKALLVLSFAAVICTWVNADPRNPIVQLVQRTTEPLFRPFRRISGRLLPGIDLSPMLFMVALLFVYTLISELLIGLISAG